MPLIDAQRRLRPGAPSNVSPPGMRNGRIVGADCSSLHSTPITSPPVSLQTRREASRIHSARTGVVAVNPTKPHKIQQQKLQEQLRGGMGRTNSKTPLRTTEAALEIQ